MTPDSYFSVIAPEAATAILKRPPADAPAVAAQQRLRPQDLVELGIARGIVDKWPCNSSERFEQRLRQPT